MRKAKRNGQDQGGRCERAESVRQIGGEQRMPNGLIQARAQGWHQDGEDLKIAQLI
jgi:hypothetical protein